MYVTIAMEQEPIVTQISHNAINVKEEVLSKENKFLVMDFII